MSGSISKSASAMAAMLPIGCGHLRESRDELELIAKIARDQEVLADVLAPRRGHALSERGIPQQIEAARGAFFSARDEIPGHTVLDLYDDAADLPRDDRNALPQSFRDHETEPFAQRLLDHDLGRALERVHLAVLDAVEIREEEDVRIATSVLARPVEVLLALGI